jgi:hypothetical protein
MATTPRAHRRLRHRVRSPCLVAPRSQPACVAQEGRAITSGNRLARDRLPIVIEMSACPLESRARGLVPWSLQPIAARQNGLRQFGFRSAHCGTEQDEFDIAQVG